MTLVEFLLARIAEVDQLAMSIAARHRDDVESNFALWVLADCRAKRRLLDLHKMVTEDYSGEWWTNRGDSHVRTGCDDCRHCGVDGQDYIADGPCSTLRLLALPYSDHPDYREEWRP